MKNVDLPRASDLPQWVQGLRDRYLTTDTSQFVLHGNVHDVVLGGGRVWSMQDFLDAFFMPSNKLVVHYDPGMGLRFGSADHAARAAKVLVDVGFLPGSKIASRATGKPSRRALAEGLTREVEHERDPTIVLPVLEALLAHVDTPCAVILHYAELIAPAGNPSHLTFDDRTASATLHRWSLWDEMIRSDNVVLLLTASLADLAPLIARNPRIGSLQVPLPGPLDRARFLAHQLPRLDPDRGEQLTRVSAGLQLRQIQDLLKIASNSGDTPPKATTPASVWSRHDGSDQAIPLEAIADRKKEILEQECYGLIEVIDPDHDFSVVGGLEPIKAALLRIASHVRAGRRSQTPLGILLVGPMGTGKSFVAEAFARESGLAAIKLKNFRDKWVGSTEANLEKVLNVIEGLGEILVIIDEGDRSIGGGGGDADGGVNARVMARLKEFMSDPDHRGRVIFMMMTNRPDKLDTDMKRPGRFDAKIPFFVPQDAVERAAIVRAVIARHGIDTDLPDEMLLPILEPLDGYGAADLEAAVLLAYDDFDANLLPDGLSERPEKLTAPFLAQAVRDFMPTRETAMMAYMELLAIHEASNRRLLPERFRQITVEELGERLAEARRRAHA